MTGNPKFTSPDISIEVLNAKTDLLESRSVATLSGGKEETSLLHQTIEDWNDTMRKMAKYVDRIADGDGAIILSAGFNLAKQPLPSMRPEFSVELGKKSGTVHLRHHAVEGAKSYIWQMCTGETPTSENNWMLAKVTSKATVEISGLTPLTKYWFRVAAVTTAGTLPYCPAVMQVVI
jgi:hypothetical protein